MIVLWFKPSRQLSTRQPLAHSFYPPTVGWGREWEKVKTCELRRRQFNRKAKEEMMTIMITTAAIVISTQNKWCTMQLLTTQWTISSPSPSSNCCPPATSPSVYTEHDVIWYGTSLWPVWVSCPSCVSSQVPMHLAGQHEKLKSPWLFSNN